MGICISSACRMLNQDTPVMLMMTGERDRRERLEFTVRGPVPILLEDERTDHRSGCSVLDITFTEPVTVGEIVFKNYYTAYLSISCRRIPVDEDGKADRESIPWETCIRRMTLMQDPHCENGSQDVISIPQKQSRLAWLGVVALRLVLRQPSPQWRKFGIEDLRLFREPPSDQKLKLNLPKIFLSEKYIPVKEKGLQMSTRQSSAATHLQNMWAITELAKSFQTDATVGRFEVGGSYDVISLTHS